MSSFNRLIGIRFVEKHADGVTIECDVKPELMNAAGVVHGGVAATLADVAVGMAVSNAYGRNQTITTVELKVNYLRPVTAGKIIAKSRLIKAGRTLAVGQADVFDAQDRQIAVALITYSKVGPPKSDPQPQPDQDVETYNSETEPRA